MNQDVHLDVGTRIINTKDGRLGKVEAPHYLARPYHHEICVRYDKDGPEASACEDRKDIEYEGNGAFERAMKHWHPSVGDAA